VPVDRQQLQRALRLLAARQAGYFTAAQARDVGYSYQAQKFHADRGNWHRVDRGLFRFPEWPVGDFDQLVRYSLWAGPDAVVSHESALAVHGLGDADPAVVHLSVPPGFRRTRSGLAAHRAHVCTEDIDEREGFRVTKAVRAIAETAQSALSQGVLDSAVQDALADGTLSPRAMRDAAARLGPRAELGVERALFASARR
jgi:predicted transcriptional regulator of viral defense system